ncbi:hypothetical protein TVAG_166760 [Trichomonas vaginalis G3]|uniref:Uncharacterized protein n=1 Tax=Trichomonas vaginalis (strain ATCC PRA-98 / G3) TaxID=412133 RepID=A2DE83_TRIV3|nr:mannose-6-phosphate receptor family member family [Trichomonas vaginalis G3]EAY21301.1 hypothetical protein TVAG_166760 [Trichomonas vaginalis G3]KAI5548961.1 mannose-6-phosphate receptor family member family [Trichomonas vaginalis G3]|eukprot:XP_001582287.1 hypothetical protein [Trichomonas vaginalis G3]
MFLSFFTYRSFEASLRSTPIEPYRCGANIDGYLYNVSEIAANNKVYTYSDEDADYYMRLCDDLTHDQLPKGITIPFGVNGIRIDKNTKFVEPIAFHDTQTYDYDSSQNPKNGFIIKTSAQATNPYSKYKYFNVVFDFVNEPMATNDDVEPTIMTIPQGDALIISLYFITPLAIPTEVDPPPDPPLPPTCKYIYDSEKVYPYGINLNLYKMNYGAHGVPAHIDGDPDTLVLYQPCGFSNCPTDFNCSGYKSSAAWVCHRNGTWCEGFSNPRATFNRLYEDPDEGFRINYMQQDDNHLTVDFTCDFELQENEIWIEKAQLVDASTLKIRARTNEACMKPLIQPSPEQCAKTLMDAENYTVNVDLTKYNIKGGTKFDVTNAAWPLSHHHWIVTQPCGPLPCPGDICPDSTAATVWLCWDDVDGQVTCDDFGLYRKMVDIELYHGTTLSNGVAAKYEGTNSSATVRMICDWNLKAGEIKYRPEVFFNDEFNTEIAITAATRDVCIGEPPVPQPTPQPTSPPTPGWAPPTPSPTVSPKPKQDTSVQFDISNASHNIAFMIDQLLFVSDDVYIDWNDHTVSAKVVSSPFNPVICPPSMNCNGHHESDFWLCWSGNCYPMMDARKQGLKHRTRSEFDGAILSANGYYDTNLVLDISCDESRKKPMVHTIIEYDGTNKYTVSLNWAEACPDEGASEPIFPPKPKQPTPKPANKPYPIKNEEESLWYDYSKLKRVDMEMKVFKSFNSLGMQKVQLIFNPQEVENCPSDANCAGVEKSSCWKCWTNETGKFCMSYADTRYKTESMSDNRILYKGGYANSSVLFYPTCEENLSISDLVLSDFSIETEDYQLDLVGHSKMFCPGNKKPTSGGFIFFSVLVLIISLYFVGGVLFNFTVFGRLELPNAEFWSDVPKYTRNLLSIITCNKVRNDAASSYDAI